MRVGVHESTSPYGFRGAVEAAMDRGCNTLQVFLKPKQSYWFVKQFKQTAAGIADLLRAHDMTMVAHAGFFISLVSPDDRIRKLSVSSLIQELDAAFLVGAEYLVVHPGSVGIGGDKDFGYEMLQMQLESVLSGYDFKTKLLLEFMPGSGGQLGDDVEKMMSVKAYLQQRGLNIGFCLDTCHMFAAGYDFDSVEHVYHSFMPTVLSLLGEDSVPVIHCNGAKFGRGSKKDGHGNLFNSAINPEVFKWMREDKSLQDKTFILETPTECHSENLNFFRGVASENGIY